MNKPGEIYRIADARLRWLRQRHANFQRELDDENQRPLPDQIRVYELKRRKLRIKDEIFRLERSAAEEAGVSA